MLETPHTYSVVKYCLQYGMALLLGFFCAGSVMKFILFRFLVRNSRSGKYIHWVCHQFYVTDLLILNNTVALTFKCSKYAICLLGCINGKYYKNKFTTRQKAELYCT